MFTHDDRERRRKKRERGGEGGEEHFPAGAVGMTTFDCDDGMD